MLLSLVPQVPVQTESVRFIDVLEGNASKLHEQGIGVYVGHIFGRGFVHPPNYCPAISLESQ